MPISEGCEVTTTEEEAAQVKAEIEFMRVQLENNHRERVRLACENGRMRDKMAILHSRLAQLEGAS